MRQYHELLRRIMDEGSVREDRTGVGTVGVFGHQMRFDLRQGFPLLTTKRIPFRFVLHELLWFLRGETHVKSLQEAGVTIWNEWATPEQCARFDRLPGDLGPVYGHQWRNFDGVEVPNVHGLDLGSDEGHRTVPLSGEYLKNGVDQIAWVVNEIRKNPSSRRLIVTAWNPREAQQVALPPCHTLFQFYVQDRRLSCQLYQRSGDAFLGVPFNIASYALLTHMVAHVTGLGVGDFVHTLGDVHLYRNHLEQAKLQLTREPRDLSVLMITAGQDEIDDFRAEHFTIAGYDPHPTIKAQVAV